MTGTAATPSWTSCQEQRVLGRGLAWSPRCVLGYLAEVGVSQLGAGGYAEFGVDAAQVRVDGAWAEEHLAGGLPGAGAGRRGTRRRTSRSGLLVLRGAPGTGKSALLDDVAASSADMRVLQATGIQGEAELAFAGLHQLV